jgi:hypothetical protein
LLAFRLSSARLPFVVATLSFALLSISTVHSTILLHFFHPPKICCFVFASCVHAAIQHPSLVVAPPAVVGLTDRCPRRSGYQGCSPKH